MEYHCGIFISRKEWQKGSYFIIMASNSDNDNLSFFVKIFSENEEISEELNSLEFGHAVYFISEKENILDIRNIDDMLSPSQDKGFPRHCVLKDVALSVYETGVATPTKLLKPIDNFSNLELELMNSRLKKLFYDEYLNLSSKYTADYLLKIIEEEKKIVESYDIDDILKELNIDHSFKTYERTDEPESYELYEHRYFSISSKYYSHNLDGYLSDICGTTYTHKLLEENEGWFYAQDMLEEAIRRNPIDAVKIKNEIKQNYSQTEHLNYRVSIRFWKLKDRIFKLISNTGSLREVPKEKIENHLGLLGQRFNFTDKESILGYIKNCCQFDKYFDVV